VPGDQTQLRPDLPYLKGGVGGLNSPVRRAFPLLGPAGREVKTKPYLWNTTMKIGRMYGLIVLWGVFALL